MSASMCKNNITIKSKTTPTLEECPSLSEVYILEMKSDLDRVLEPEITIQIQKHCSKCNLSFDSTQDYDDHNTKLHNLLEPLKTTFRCNLCDISFARRYHLKRHMETKHPDFNDSDESTHECDDFKIEPPKKQPVILEPQKKKFTCSLCMTSFGRHEHLKRHLATKHVQYNKTECPFCSKIFKKKKLLLQHLAANHADQNFTCMLCLFQCSDYTEFEKHNLSHFKNAHACPECNATFKRRDHMLRHINSIHIKQVKSCLLCDLKFTRQDHLTKHLREKHSKVMINNELVDL